MTFRLDGVQPGRRQASEITLHDELPPGTTLDDPDWTDNGDGTASLTHRRPARSRATRPASTSPCVVDRPAPDGTITNTAEISAALDGGGNEAVDDDSTPDLDLSDDPLVDDEIDDDGTTRRGRPRHRDGRPRDARVRPGAAQATGRRRRAPRWRPVTTSPSPSRCSTRATPPATDVVVTDYLPASMTLNDADWTDNGDGTAQVTLPGTLDPGESTRRRHHHHARRATAGPVTSTTTPRSRRPTTASVSAATTSTPRPTPMPTTTPSSTTRSPDPAGGRRGRPRRGPGQLRHVRPGAAQDHHRLAGAGRRPGARSRSRCSTRAPLEANDIVVTDYLPAELAFNAGDNPGWSLVGGQPHHRRSPGRSRPVTRSSVDARPRGHRQRRAASTTPPRSPAATGPGGLVVDRHRLHPDRRPRATRSSTTRSTTAAQRRGRSRHRVDRRPGIRPGAAQDHRLDDLVVPGELVSFDDHRVQPGRAGGHRHRGHRRDPRRHDLRCRRQPRLGPGGRQPDHHHRRTARARRRRRRHHRAAGRVDAGPVARSPTPPRSRPPPTRAAARHRHRLARRHRPRPTTAWSTTRSTTTAPRRGRPRHRGRHASSRSTWPCARSWPTARPPRWSPAIRCRLRRSPCSTRATWTPTDITITDTLPAGTTLDDAAWTDNGDGTAHPAPSAGPSQPGDTRHAAHHPA